MGLDAKNAKSAKKTWPMVRLGDVCEINLGKTPPRGSRDCWDPEKSSGNVWVSISDMSNLIGGKIDDSKEYITRYAIESVGVPVVSKGTLLLSFKLTLGRTAIAGCDLYTNEAIAALPVKNDFKRQIYIPFLSTYFSFFDWNGFAAKDEKLLGKTLNKKKLAAIPIPLPPLSVQREIVARLEKELGEADALAAKFKEIAENADAEFKAELDETFKNVEGEKVRLGEVCEIKRGRVINKKYLEAHKGMYPVYSSQTLHDGIFGYIDTFDFEGEFLTWTTDGANAGSVFYHNGKFSITNVCGLLKIRDRGMDARWLLHYLTLNAKSYVNKSLGNPKLMSNVVANIPMVVPALTTQRTIVARLDTMRERCDKLKAAAERGSRAAEDLRKSILAEAFEQ